MFNVNEWNKKIYKNDDDTFVEGGMHAKEFYDEFGIESFPLFRDKCYYHVPQKWADDVRIFLKQVKDELGQRIKFQQIKEKWCHFTVYYQAADDDARKRIEELQKECISRLIEKGIHPPKDIWEQNNDQ